MTYAAGIRAHQTSGRPLVTHIHATEFDRSIGGANPAIVERERTGSTPPRGSSAIVPCSGGA